MVAEIAITIEKVGICMGLLGKVIGAGACLVGAGAEAIGKGIENAFLKQEKKNMEYLSKYPYKYKYIVREVKHKMDDMSYAEFYGLDKDFFTVSDINNQPMYVAKSVTTSGKHRYVVMDMEQVGIAAVESKNALLSSNKRNCIIEFNSEKYELSTNGVFDKRKFSISNSDMRIDVNETGKEIRVRKGGKVLFQVNKISSDLGMKWGEYVIGCNSENDKILMILFSIGIGAMLIESENLLDTK